MRFKPSSPFAAAVFAPLLAIVASGDAAAQSDLRFPPDASELAPGAQGVDPHTGERLAVQQDGDSYSVTGMFHELHGEFLQNAFRFSQDLRLSYRYQADTELSGETGDFSWQQVAAVGRFATPLDPDMVLITGMQLGAREYDFEPETGLPDDELHEVAAAIGLGRFFSEDLYVEAVFRPGLYTDFSGTLTGDAWKFYADVLGTYRFDAGFFGHFGVAYDGTFDDMPVYPMLGFGLMIGEEFRLDLLAPRYFEFSWLPDPAWILKVGLAVDGNEFRVRSRSDDPGGRQAFDVRVQEVDLYLDGTYRLDDRISIFGRVGSTLTGDYDWNYPGNRYDGSSDPTMFLEAGIGFDF